MEDTAVRVAAMAAGRLDVVATTIDTVMPFMTEPQQFRYIFAVDDSKGGDGIVADQDIRSLADLRGKKSRFWGRNGVPFLSCGFVAGGRTDF